MRDLAVCVSSEPKNGQIKICLFWMLEFPWRSPGDTIERNEVEPENFPLVLTGFFSAIPPAAPLQLETAEASRFGPARSKLIGSRLGRFPFSLRTRVSLAASLVPWELKNVTTWWVVGHSAPLQCFGVLGTKNPQRAPEPCNVSAQPG